jgi:CelD/BcsL family acetyltransferase involved in cellulose biosynthesis
MNVTIIDPITDSRWDDFVKGHPESTVFHCSAWFRVLRDRYRCNLICYIVEDENGEITAGMPFIRIQSRLAGRRLACLPCSEYCYPLAYSPEAVVQLMAAAKNEVDCGHTSFLEIRGWKDLIKPDVLGLAEFTFYLRHVTALDEDLEKLRTGLEKAYHLKRNLKKAESAGLNVRECQDEACLKQFYHLSVQTRRRLNLLPWPYKFIKSIYRHVIVPGHGFLLLAELDGKPIAGSLFLCFKDSVILKISASDKDYSQYRGNYLVIWKAMERACREGYKYFDFGISDFDNSGLIAFKRQWGSDETPVPYYYYSTAGHSKLMPKMKSAYRSVYTITNRLMPDFASKLAARALYRHLG